MAAGLHPSPWVAASGSFAGARPRDPRAPSPRLPTPSGRRMLGAPGPMHGHRPHPMMPPRCQQCCQSTPQAQQPPTLQNVLFLALKGTKMPHGKARAGTQADIQAKSERPGTTPISAGRCRWQVPAAGSSPPCQVQPKPAHKSKLCDPPKHKQLCGAVQALLARSSVRVLAP